MSELVVHAGLCLTSSLIGVLALTVNNEILLIVKYPTEDDRVGVG